MKTMTCTQLGGPCETALSGETADDVIKAQDAHLRQAGDEAHASALADMQGRWQDPAAGRAWYEKAKGDFEAQPQE